MSFFVRLYFLLAIFLITSPVFGLQDPSVAWYEEFFEGKKVKRATQLIRICKAKLTSTEEDVNRILKDLENPASE